MYIKTLRSVKVELCLNGKPAREYPDPYSTHPSLKSEKTSFVEAITGAPVSIRFTAVAELGLRNGDRLAYRIYVDGEEFLYQHMNSAFDCVGASVQVCDGRNFRTEDGKCYKQPLQLQEVVYDDVLDTLTDAQLKKLNKAGIITVEIFTVNKVIESPRKGAISAARDKGELKPVPAKATKATAETKSHYVVYGAPIGSRSVNWVHAQIWSEPFAKYHFKYRSRYVLETLDIIQDENKTAIPPPRTKKRRCCVSRLMLWMLRK